VGFLFNDELRRGTGGVIKSIKKYVLGTCPEYSKQAASTLSRFGLCFGAIIILSIYSGAAIHLAYYLPIGVVLMSAYSWLVIKNKGIYPIASRAIGQLCITFLVAGLASSNQMNQIKKSIVPGAVADNATIHSLAFNVAQSNVASVMFSGLLITYLISKRRRLHN
jgi:hypothetical protein